MTVDIWQIITYLNTITEITDIVWNRIFWWLPNNEQTWTYIVLTLITERQPTLVENINRVEVRMIWGDSTVSYSTLFDLNKKVFSKLQEYKQDWVYKIVNQNLVQWYDEKSRKLVLKDILIHKN